MASNLFFFLLLIGWKTTNWQKLLKLELIIIPDAEFIKPVVI